MFTGIVETIGQIIELIERRGLTHFTIKPMMPFDDLNIGDSIAVNGVCLTITEFSPDEFKVTAVPQTLRLTNLGALTLHHYVNLERALRPTDRLGGHYLQGHVEGTGEIIDIKSDRDSEALLVTIAVPPLLTPYIINQGYIALDGMSITVIEAKDAHCRVTFIPHTKQVTIVRDYQLGTAINIETDIIGKYVKKLLEGHYHAS